MLLQPTLDKLSEMRLAGLRQALEEQQANPQYAELSFEERFGLLIDQEWTRRYNARLKRRLKAAGFRQSATIEEIDFSPARGHDRSQVLRLATGEWIARHLNAIVTGPTGAGKTFLACALGRAACKAAYAVRYERLNHLLHRIALSHADGSWPKLMKSLSRIQLLVIDDWLRDPLTPSQARDLVEVLEDRYARSSTLVVTQVPLADWHTKLGDQDLADAIMDRLVHNAYRISLKGDSQRKLRSELTMSST